MHCSERTDDYLSLCSFLSFEKKYHRLCIGTCFHFILILSSNSDIPHLRTYSRMGLASTHQLVNFAGHRYAASFLFRSVRLHQESNARSAVFCVKHETKTHDTRRCGVTWCVQGPTCDVKILRVRQPTSQQWLYTSPWTNRCSTDALRSSRHETPTKEYTTSGKRDG